MRFWIKPICSGVAAIAALSAATFWFWSASIEIPTNIDTFIVALQHASRLSSYAATSAGVAAICAVIHFVDEWWS